MALPALAGLDERSRRIVEERWLKVNDDGSGGMTLHELAAEYGVSAERIRQIEVAMKKMKKALAEQLDSPSGRWDKRYHLPLRRPLGPLMAVESCQRTQRFASANNSADLAGFFMVRAGTVFCC
jgi:hypothetical protein